MAHTKKPWDKKNPKAASGRSKKLSPAKKAAAKARAKKAGRRYPNLIDNMQAAKAKKPATKRPKKSAH